MISYCLYYHINTTIGITKINFIRIGIGRRFSRTCMLPPPWQNKDAVRRHNEHQSPPVLRSFSLHTRLLLFLLRPMAAVKNCIRHVSLARLILPAKRRFASSLRGGIFRSLAISLSTCARRDTSVKNLPVSACSRERPMWSASY
jgi:hypothetical protein